MGRPQLQGPGVASTTVTSTTLTSNTVTSTTFTSTTVTSDAVTPVISTYSSITRTTRAVGMMPASPRSSAAACHSQHPPRLFTGALRDRPLGDAVTPGAASPRQAARHAPLRRYAMISTPLRRCAVPPLRRYTVAPLHRYTRCCAASASCPAASGSRVRCRTTLTFRRWGRHRPNGLSPLAGTLVTAHPTQQVRL